MKRLYCGWESQENIRDSGGGKIAGKRREKKRREKRDSRNKTGQTMKELKHISSGGLAVMG